MQSKVFTWIIFVYNNDNFKLKNWICWSVAQFVIDVAVNPGTDGVTFPLKL